MSTISTSLQVRGLGKQKMAALVARARRLGMSPQRYLKHLLEEDLAVSQRAKSSSFEEILGAGREVDEREIDQLVEEAKARHHRKLPRSPVVGAAK
jgi:superfamily I DNA/RNA helicase